MVQVVADLDRALELSGDAAAHSARDGYFRRAMLGVFAVAVREREPGIPVDRAMRFFGEVAGRLQGLLDCLGTYAPITRMDAEVAEEGNLASLCGCRSSIEVVRE